ncbi:hypothetical protein [Deinococcus hohokamensis]|uniref:Uncharacterized protein n=1 Tax=Deinococcus hohokamensis TaxID=309883 RepID=A0ABV9I802_9DEIO
MTKSETVSVHLLGNTTPLSFRVDESELATLLRVAEEQAGSVALQTPQGLAYLYGRHIQRIIRPEFRDERIVESADTEVATVVTTTVR